MLKLKYNHSENCKSIKLLVFYFTVFIECLVLNFNPQACSLTLNSYFIILKKKFKIFFTGTVKPVYKSHSWDPKKVAVVQRLRHNCSLFTVYLVKGNFRFWYRYRPTFWPKCRFRYRFQQFWHLSVSADLSACTPTEISVPCPTKLASFWGHFKQKNSLKNIARIFLLIKKIV